MDVILKGILDSSHPFELKKALVNTVVIPAAKDSKITPEQCRQILKLALDLVLWSQAEDEAEMGFNIFNSCAQASDLSTILDEQFFDCMFVSKIGKSCNKCTVTKVVRVCLKMGNCYALEAITRKTTSFIDVQRILSVGELADVFEEFPDLLSKVTDPTRVAIELVDILANFDCPPELKKSPVEIFKLIGKVCTFCGSIRSRVPVGDLAAVFVKIYSALSSNVKEPSVCLASVTKFVPVEVLPDISHHLLSKITQQDGLDVVLARVIDWLPWPLGENIDLWVVVWMKALADAGMFSVLVRITNDSIEKICMLLQRQIKMSTSSALTVITFMLLSFQNSPMAFHKILPHVPSLIQAMKDNECECSVKALAEFSELLHLQMERYSGFPELYGPVLDSLKGVTIEIRRTGLLEVTPWDSTPEMSQSFLALLPRSQTGKLGLNNLGNTCYMNSVLQALYMTDQFRNSVLTSSPKATQKLLVKLQYVFAFLTHSKRVTYSPKSFHEASKPPWFEAFRQQDCSEFLHYLFDTLHEQETELTKSPLSPKRALNDSSSMCCAMHEMFGGKLSTRLECLECRNVSEGTESFVDIPLAFPCLTKANLEDLVGHFFAPEILDGENSYSCGSCQCLRSAEKRVNVTELPKCLVVNLMRFGYDSSTQKRNKILTDVSYPEVLKLPGHDSESYELYAVVVHSGASSDAGHYYTYARNRAGCTKQEWFLFNDSNVTFADFESFQHLGERFTKDTAYLLFYERSAGERQASENPRTIQIRKDLMEAVERDNMSFVKEEKEAAEMRRKRETFLKRDSWRDFDDNPPDSFGSGSDHIARFVF